MTNQEKEKQKELQQSLQQENQTLKTQLLVLQDLQNLNQESYFRQQVLILLERIATALEKVSSEENSSKEDDKSEDDEGEEEEE